MGCRGESRGLEICGGVRVQGEGCIVQEMIMCGPRLFVNITVDNLNIDLLLDELVPFRICEHLL